MPTFTEAELAPNRSWPIPAERVRLPSPAHRSATVGAALLLADMTASLVLLKAIEPAARILSGHALPAAGPERLSVDGLAMASLALFLGFAGHYGEKLPASAEWRQLALAGLFAFLLAGCAESLLHLTGPVRLSAVAWLCFPPLSFAARTAAKLGLDRLGFWRTPVLLVENAEGGSSSAAVLRTGLLPPYHVASVVGLELAEQVAASGRWEQLLARHDAVGVAVATGSARDREGRIVESVLRARLPVLIVSRMSALPVLGWRTTPFLGQDAVLLSHRSGQGARPARIAKRMLDMLVAAALLVLALPFMAVIALLVASDGGSPIFAHERVGANGVRFRCLKFRTMVTDAASVLDRALLADPALAAEWAATRKLRHDPRITPVGRMLRRTSLDELPQLLNVLRGEMSLVGPRPIVDAEIGRYEDEIGLYYEGRPGVTGLWQVSGRSDTSFEQRVRLDSAYVRNWSLFHDVAILAKTVAVVLRRRGAH